MRGATIVQPDLNDTGLGVTNREWGVMIFDDDHTPRQWVVAILMKATGCSPEEAEMETWEAEHYGRSLVHYGSSEECNRVAAAIEGIGVRVKVVEI